MIRKFPCFLPGHGNVLVLKRGKIHNVKSLACVADAWAIQSAKMNGSKGGGSVDVHEGREEATSFSLRLYPSIAARSVPIFESSYNTKCINYYFQLLLTELYITTRPFEKQETITYTKFAGQTNSETVILQQKFSSVYEADYFEPFTCTYHFLLFPTSTCILTRETSWSRVFMGGWQGQEVPLFVLNKILNIWIYGPFRHQKNKKSNKQTDKKLSDRSFNNSDQ